MVIRKRKDWLVGKEQEISGRESKQVYVEKRRKQEKRKQRYENEAKSSVSCTDPEWGLHFCKHTNRSSEMDTARI